MNDEAFLSRLETALARHTGRPAKVHDLQRLTGGANRTTMSFDASETGANGPRRQFIVQLGTHTFDPVAGIVPQIAPADQARVMIAAARAGAPAPRVVAILEPADGLGEGYITERVAGETLGSRIVRDERFAAARRVMARQCGEILAAIHRIDPADAPFLMRQEAAEHVAAHRQAVDNCNFRLPALELALRWAAENAPRNKRLTVLHGDFRNGNLIIGPDGVRAVLDWEIAHVGDPMEDFGWICTGSWRFGQMDKPVGGFGEREDLWAGYEAAGGAPVSRDQALWWEVYGSMRWGVMCASMVASFRSADPSVERAVIARRTSENEVDLLRLLAS
jgi:aminoglycoside phosphotransferase (APT) family kinase protein